MQSTPLARYVPALGWLSTYDRSWLRSDVVAALTLWALVVPQAIAYAQIAGLTPAAGLFTAFAGLLTYALLGTSRQLVVSPTSSTAAISAALVLPLVAGGGDYAAMSSALAIMVGGVLILLGLLKMGFVSRFIAAGVQTGFMFGLGLTIILGQLPALLGVTKGDGGFFPQLASLVSNLGEIDPGTALIGVGGLAALLGLRRVKPDLPAALLVVVTGIALVALFGLDGHGVAVIGQVDGAVPLPALPGVSGSDLVALLPGALAIAVIGYAESATVAESLADEHEYEVRSDQELRAVGAANIVAGFSQGFITGGGASQSAANDRAGARTELASLIVAGLTALTSIALLPLFRDLPLAILSAIVISAVMGFLDVAALRRILQVRRDSFGLALLTLVSVLVLGVLAGLLLAVTISVLLLLTRAARPQGSVLGRTPGGRAYVALDREPAARTEPGLLAYRQNAPLLFVNAKHLRQAVRDQVQAAEPPVRIVLLDLSFSANLDVESINVLSALQRELRAQETELWLVNVHPAAHDLLDRASRTEGGAVFRAYHRVQEAETDLGFALGQGIERREGNAAA